MTTPLHHRHRDPKPELTYYVSGPMRGIPRYNFPMFDSCAAWLRSEGYGAINPADHDREVDPACESRPDHATGDPTLVEGWQLDFEKLLGWDLREIASPHCHGIVMLPGWEKSVGSAHERYVAEACGKQVWLAHYTGTTAAYHDPVRDLGGTDSIEYHGWYMTLCEDRLLSSFTAEGLREALNPPLKARGWVEREPDTFVKDIERLRQRAYGVQPVIDGTGRAYGSVQPTPTPVNDLHSSMCDEGPNHPGTCHPQIGQFQTKDSGRREEFTSGMVRDTQEGKPRYDLIPLSPLKRMAELYARGAQKYGDRNWEKATGPEELERFKASCLRHLFQALMGDRDEDHWAGAVFNIFGAMWLEERLSQVPSVMENDKVQRPDDDGKP